MKHSAEQTSQAVALIAMLLVMIAAMASAVAASPEVRMDKDVYAPNEPIVVPFSNVPGNNTDWMTVVPKGTAVGRYKQWVYLRGEPSAAHEFRGPPAGEYEARLFITDSRTELAVQ